MKKDRYTKVMAAVYIEGFSQHSILEDF